MRVCVELIGMKIMAIYYSAHITGYSLAPKRPMQFKAIGPTVKSKVVA